jgi:hypothetical protein
VVRKQYENNRSGGNWFRKQESYTRYTKTNGPVRKPAGIQPQYRKPAPTTTFDQKEKHRKFYLFFGFSNSSPAAEVYMFGSTFFILPERPERHLSEWGY